MALDLFRLGSTQRRYAGAGVCVGLDLPALLTLGDALGHDRAAMARLLPALEAGLMRAKLEHADG